jgi:hypothetical protein
MSMDLSGEITAIATATLAFFAIVTGVYAVRAFRKQSQEVSAIEHQVKDQEELTRQQAALLEIQGRQLDLQQKQFDQQAHERRRAQASCIFIWVELGPDPGVTDDQLTTGEPDHGLIFHVTNTSNRPIYDLSLDWGEVIQPHPWMLGDYTPVLMADQELTRFRHYPYLTWDDYLMERNEPLPMPPIARFRDSAGLYWLLTSEGQLDEQQRTRNSTSEPSA